MVSPCSHTGVMESGPGGQQGLQELSETNKSERLQVLMLYHRGDSGLLVFRKKKILFSIDFFFGNSVSLSPHVNGVSPPLTLFPGGSKGKESACNAGDQGSMSGSGRSPGEGNGNLLQYSCLENSMDRGAWWATVLGVTKSWT